MLLSNLDGTFQAPVSYAARNGASSVAVVDLNRDGNADLVVTNMFDNSISILRGNGDGTFQPQQVIGGVGEAVQRRGRRPEWRRNPTS